MVVVTVVVVVLAGTHFIPFCRRPLTLNLADTLVLVTVPPQVCPFIPRALALDSIHLSVVSGRDALPSETPPSDTSPSEVSPSEVSPSGASSAMTKTRAEWRAVVEAEARS